MTTPVPPTAVWIDQTTTRINPDYATSTPPDATARGLGEFLNRVDRFVADPAGTVMLDGTIPRQLGFAGGPPGPGQTGTEPLRRARERGWTIKEERVWMTAVRKDKGGRERTIHIGIVPWLSARTFALFAPHDPLLMQWRMYEWARMLGVPFHGEQVALSGHDVIRDRCTLKKIPKWLFPATQEIEPARKTTELPFAWTAPQPRQGWVHQFDATAQHMAALNNVHVSGDLLQHRKPGKPGRENPPGYYRVVPPAWSDSRIALPHPIGRLPDGPTSPVWVTHVTLDFLMELHEVHGIVDPPELLDSWTSDYRCRAFRTYGAIMSKALRDSATYDEDPVMHTAIKNVYKATVGLMARPGGRIHRPDWTHAVIAQARCDLWRKGYYEGAKLTRKLARLGETRTGSGAWPVEFETDALWYASPTDQPNWPATFLKGDGLTPGTFVVKKSRKVGE